MTPRYRYLGGGSVKFRCGTNHSIAVVQTTAVAFLWEDCHDRRAHVWRVEVFLLSSAN